MRAPSSAGYLLILSAMLWVGCDDDGAGNESCPPDTIQADGGCVPDSNDAGDDADVGVDVEPAPDAPIDDADHGDGDGPSDADLDAAGLSFPFAVDDVGYLPSGFMGDGTSPFAVTDKDDCVRRAGDEVGRCHHIVWRPPSWSVGWAGVYWQYPDGNWGSEPGLDLPAGAAEVTFYAWGATGGEVVDFQVGMGDVDGFNRGTGDVTLTTDPRLYSIDLSGVAYSDVVGAFAWTSADSTEPVEFFIDDIQWLGLDVGDVDVGNDVGSDLSDVDMASDAPDDGSLDLDVDLDADVDADLDADVGSDPDADQGPIELALFGEPLSIDAPPLSTATHSLQPSNLWADTTRPLPTNAWWLNFVIGGGDLAVNAYPYPVRATGGRLVVSESRMVASDRAYVSQLLESFRFTAAESLGSHQVVAWDDLSVTLQWSPTEGTMTVPLVRGSPYVTATYHGLRPVLSSQFVISLDASPNPGTRFEATLDNGTRWIIYTSSQIEWVETTRTLTATAAFDGSIRVALVGGGDDAESLLDTHSGVIPTGGLVAATSVGDTATLSFDWTVEGGNPPLMMALPHHLPTLQTPVDDGLTYATIRGTMTAVAGDPWVFAEPLTTIGWSAPSGIDPAHRADVVAALEADADFATVATDPYFFGKQVAAMGRLALIADELGRTDLATSIRSNIASELAPWATSSRGDPLVYDVTWGGVVLQSAIGDPGASFGQGYYNDHHFHYGYHIYAAAALARGDAAWAVDNADYVLTLIRDIANPSSDDPYFTFFRNMDWYAGHSWAAGLFQAGDSRNQESTSEAVNAYYAVCLWGLATDDRRLYDLGRLALATELRASQVYWQIRDDNEIYPSPFKDRGVVGILWDLKADYTTWFGNNDELIYGIQLLPFTPISEALFDPVWVADVYPFIASDILGRTNPPLAEGWRGFMLMFHAVIDPTTAWNEVQTLTSYDDGNTETNTLYWVSTRP